MVSYVQSDKSPLVVQDPKLAPRSAKKRVAQATKKKKGNIIPGHIKAVDASLEGFMVALGSEAAKEIIDRWTPFNKRESSITHMRDLYPTFLRVRVAAHAKEYSIPFSGYLDRKSFQRMAEDGMLIRNHDFNCHTPIPGPTRLADPNRVRGTRPYTGTFLFFLKKAELVPVGMAYIL